MTEQTDQISKVAQTKSFCVLQMVIEPPWSRDYYVRPLGDGDRLGHHVHPSDQDGAADTDG
jgi:hypothetical protein